MPLERNLVFSMDDVGITCCINDGPNFMFMAHQKLPNRSEISIPKLGDWTSYERRVLIIFALTALFWITLREPFGGWTTWFH